MSKGLEMLEILKQRNGNLKINHKIGSRDIANQEIKEITQCFDNYVIPVIEKELKALEIIKTKNVDIFFLINSCDEVDKYNEEIIDNTMYYCYSNCRKLTQEEFDLLKEALENE